MAYPMSRVEVRLVETHRSVETIRDGRRYQIIVRAGNIFAYSTEKWSS